MSAPLILASASPRRKELLERVGFTVRTMSPNIDETRLEGEDPVNYVKRMAREKVLAIAQRAHATLYVEPEGSRSTDEDSRWIVGADTAVVLGDRVFSKPVDTDDAQAMLTELSGREHTVMTGFCVFDLQKNKEGLQAVHTIVRFKSLTKSEIEKYVGLGEGTDKAGSYAIQGVGGYFAEEIDGSYTNVVGLPLCQVIEMLQEMGATSVLPF